MSHVSAPLKFWRYAIVFLFITLFPYSLRAAEFKFPKITTVTSGRVLSPYSLQPGDDGNTYYEAFYKIGLPIWKNKKSKIVVFLSGFYSRDSLYLTFNNKSKLSFGISYGRKIHKNLNLRASLQHDRDYRPLSGAVKSGVRAKLSYFYYKSWWRNMPTDHKGWFRQKSWVKNWGQFIYPESLEVGNTNLAFATGAEIATGFVRAGRKLQYVPFAEVNFAKDSYQLSFNSKIIPAVGFKLRRPVKNGEIRLGVKYAVDRRWTKGTTRSGTVFFGGWYKSF
jgi:hypothetical protein